MYYSPSGNEATSYRIVDGVSASEGRVEVKVRGEWGSVCDDFWDMNSAHVFCRAVGYVYVFEYL